MASTDESKQFIPLNIAVLHGLRHARARRRQVGLRRWPSASPGQAITLAAREIVTGRCRGDPRRHVAAGSRTTASTSSSPPAAPASPGRDVTPEAIEPLFEKRMDGFSIAFHMLSHAKIGTSTIQSRATAGVAGATYIFCLPGSPGACRDGWDGILVQPARLSHAAPAISSRSCRGSTSICAATRRSSAPIGHAGLCGVECAVSHRCFIVNRISHRWPCIRHEMPALRCGTSGAADDLDSYLSRLRARCSIRGPILSMRLDACGQG